MRILSDAGSYRAPGHGAATRFTEDLRVPDLSVGTYSVPAGGRDDQTPHTEDHVYVIRQGRARLVTPDQDSDVAPGDVLFVPAGQVHRFVDITEDLAVLVIFGPAYRSRS